MKFWKKTLILVLLVFLVAGAIFLISRFLKKEKGRGVGQNFELLTSTPSPTESLKFAVMADIHADWENLKKALEMAKNDKADFIVVAGDLTTLGKKSELLEAKEILEESGLKYYVIPGNHDLWYGRRIKKDVFGEVFGPTSFAFSELRGVNDSGIKFILINNGDQYIGLGENQMGWLKQELEECLKIYCLVFMHVPLNHPSSGHIMGEGDVAVASEAGELVRLMVADKVKEIFAGHLHLSNFYEIDGLKTTVVGAISEDRNPQISRFLEVEVVKEGLSKDYVLKRQERELVSPTP